MWGVGGGGAAWWEVSAIGPRVGLDWETELLQAAKCMHHIASMQLHVVYACVFSNTWVPMQTLMQSGNETNDSRKTQVRPRPDQPERRRHFCLSGIMKHTFSSSDRYNTTINMHLYYMEKNCFRLLIWWCRHKLKSWGRGVFWEGLHSKNFETLIMMVYSRNYSNLSMSLWSWQQQTKWWITQYIK